MGNWGYISLPMSGVVTPGIAGFLGPTKTTGYEWITWKLQEIGIKLSSDKYYPVAESTSEFVSFLGC